MQTYLLSAYSLINLLSQLNWLKAFPNHWVKPTCITSTPYYPLRPCSSSTVKAAHITWYLLIGHTSTVAQWPEGPRLKTIYISNSLHFNELVHSMSVQMQLWLFEIRYAVFLQRLHLETEYFWSTSACCLVCYKCSPPIGRRKHICMSNETLDLKWMCSPKHAITAHCVYHFHNQAHRHKLN